MQRDFDMVVQVVPADTLEWSLAEAIRSPETPDWQDILDELYKHSNRKLQAQLLNQIVEFAPDVRRAPHLSFWKGGKIKLEDLDKINFKTIIDLPVITNAHDSTIDLVSNFYARNKRALHQLPPGVQNSVLHNLARRGEVEVLTEQARLESALADAADSVTPAPDRATDAPASEHAVAAIERYTNLAVYDKACSDTDPLDEKAALLAGRQYVLSVSIDLQRKGLPVVGPEQPIRPINVSEPVDLFVTLTAKDEEDWDIQNPIGWLRLPPAGPTDIPATFSIKPLKSGQRRPIFVRLYYRLNLIDSLVFEPFVQDGIEGAPPDGKPALYLSVVGFPKRYEIIHTDLQPQRLNITLRRGVGNKWRFTVTLGVDGGAIPLVAFATLSDHGLQDILVSTRKAWDEVIQDSVYASPAGGVDLTTAVGKLAKAGTAAWLKLFGAGGGLPALGAIRTILESNPPARGAAVQISCEEQGIDFVFPWLLLYPGQHAGEDPVDAFWGVRYALEVQGVDPVPGRRPGKACDVVYALWDGFEALSDQQRDMLASFRATRPTQIAIGKSAIESRSDLLKAFSEDFDVLYVFAHGFTREPGLSNLTVLSNYLSSKQAAGAALSDDLKALEKNVAAIAKDNQNDWIILTKSTVTLSELREAKPRFHRHPFVFLNMCHSAQMNPGLVDGFVAFFLESGACAVLGTECPMSASFATTFANDVFAELGKGASIRDAVHAARCKGASEGNPLCLAYSLYGSTDAHLVTAPDVLT